MNDPWINIFVFILAECSAIPRNVTIACCYHYRMLGYINLRPFSFQDGRQFLPASIFFALHATLSLYAIHGMNIPMYGAIKRCTPLVSLILSVLVINQI